MSAAHDHILEVASGAQATPSPSQRRSRRSPFLVNGLIVALSLAVSLVLAELVLNVLPISEGFGGGRQTEIWSRKHWQPINSLGYRDHEPALTPGLRHVAMVGDSFTAGHGVTLEETASAHLRRRIASTHGNVQVLNLGESGADTAKELENLRRLPIRPAIVILQYFGNDIEGDAEAAGYSFTRNIHQLAQQKLSPAIADLMLRSAFGELLLNAWLMPQLSKEYIRFLLRAYGDEALMARHRARFAGFADYCRKNGCSLYAFTYPFLEPGESAAALNRAYIGPVQEALRAAGAKVVDLHEEVLRVPPRQRVVNSMDAHPSPQVHELVSRRLHDAIAAELGSVSAGPSDTRAGSPPVR